MMRQLLILLIGHRVSRVNYNHQTSIANSSLSLSLNPPSYTACYHYMRLISSRFVLEEDPKRVSQERGLLRLHHPCHPTVLTPVLELLERGSLDPWQEGRSGQDDRDQGQCCQIENDHFLPRYVTDYLWFLHDRISDSHCTALRISTWLMVAPDTGKRRSVPCSRTK